MGTWVPKGKKKEEEESAVTRALAQVACGSISSPDFHLDLLDESCTSCLATQLHGKLGDQKPPRRLCLPAAMKIAHTLVFWWKELQGKLAGLPNRLDGAGEREVFVERLFQGWDSLPTFPEETSCETTVEVDTLLGMEPHKGLEEFSDVQRYPNRTVETNEIRSLWLGPLDGPVTALYTKEQDTILCLRLPFQDAVLWMVISDAGEEQPHRTPVCAFPVGPSQLVATFLFSLMQKLHWGEASGGWSGYALRQRNGNSVVHDPHVDPIHGDKSAVPLNDSPIMPDPPVAQVQAEGSGDDHLIPSAIETSPNGNDARRPAKKARKSDASSRLRNRASQHRVQSEFGWQLNLQSAPLPPTIPLPPIPNGSPSTCQHPLMASGEKNGHLQRKPSPVDDALRKDMSDLTALVSDEDHALLAPHPRLPNKVAQDSARLSTNGSADLSATLALSNASPAPHPVVDEFGTQSGVGVSDGKVALDQQSTKTNKAASASSKSHRTRGEKSLATKDIGWQLALQHTTITSPIASGSPASEQNVEINGTSTQNVKGTLHDAEQPSTSKLEEKPESVKGKEDDVGLKGGKDVKSKPESVTANGQKDPKYEEEKQQSFRSQFGWQRDLAAQSFTFPLRQRKRVENDNTSVWDLSETSKPPGDAGPPLTMAEQEHALLVENQTECERCFKHFEAELIYNPDGCSHSMCRTCIRKYILDTIEDEPDELPWPMSCPVCLVHDVLRPGQITTKNIPPLHLGLRAVHKINEAAHLAIVICPRCKLSGQVTRDRYNHWSIEKCAASPSCGHQWCKACRQPFVTGKRHECGSPTFKKLGRRKATRFCPGCHTQIQLTKITDPCIACTAVGCQYRFCFDCGDLITDGIECTEESIRAHANVHKSVCRSNSKDCVIM